MVSFDLSIRLGDLLTVLGFIGTIIAAYYTIKGRISLIEYDVSGIKKTVDHLGTSMAALTSVLTKVAVTENRLDNMDREIGDLRRGRGFIRE